jgi:hypothetical protein
MADGSPLPTGPDPFASIFSGEGKQPTAAPSLAPTPAQAQEEYPKPSGPDPFADIFNAADEQAAAPSAAGSFGLGAALSAVPAAGGLAGAAAGALSLSWLGPWGAVAGGLAGGFGGGWLTGKAQNAAISALPQDWQDPLLKEEGLAEKYHPTASFLGNILPYMLTMKPGAWWGAGAGEGATTLQRVMASPLTSHLFGAGVIGGSELGQEVASGQAPDWTKVGIATGLGLIFDKANRIGETIMAPGARAGAAVREGLQTAFPGVRRLADRFAPAPDAPPPPTVIEGSDLGIFGEAVTNGVFHESVERSFAAAMQAHAARQVEQSIIEERARAADVYEMARRLDPETMNAYDAAEAQRNSFQARIRALENPTDDQINDAWEYRGTLQDRLDEHIASRGGYAGGPVARQLRAQLREAQAEIEDLHARQDAYAAGQGVDTPEMTTLRKQLADADYAMRDLVTRRQAALRRAADAGRSEVVEPGSGQHQYVIDNTKDIPFGGGSSQNGKTVYIDKDMPTSLDVRLIGSEQTRPMPIQKFIAIHEDVERHHMVDLGEPYETAHDHALKTERAAVEAAGFDFNDYQRKVLTEVRKVQYKGHDPSIKPPEDLVTKPYPHDEAEFLKRAAAKETPGAPAAPPAATPAGVAPEVAPTGTPPVGGIPFMVTNAMKAALRAKGVSDEAIKNMTPAQAHAALAPSVPINIAEDVSRKVQAAGRPPEEAAMAGALWAANYRALADWFQGQRGTAEDLYREEGADIIGRGRPAEPVVPAEQAPEFAQRATPRELAAQIGGLRAVLKYLEPDELEKVKAQNAQTIVDIFTSLPPAEEMAAVAYSGRAKRGWYRKSAEALLRIFGAEDAPRFAALLAATSPQTGVEDNAINSLNIWRNWVDAGRPTDRDAIIKVMGESVQGEKGVDSILPAWINNTVSALSHPDPIDLELSGPKVNSFASNLRGHVNAVTLDAWMANYANVDQALFRKTGPTPGKGAGYIAYTAAVRKAADVISRLTGETWTPAEIQETIWSWAKTLYEKAGQGETAQQILKAGGLTHEEISATPDFAVLFSHGVYRNILEKAGYGEELADLERGGAGAGEPAGPAGEALRAEGSGLAQTAFERHLFRAARRLDTLREQRADAAADTLRSGERGLEPGARGDAAAAADRASQAAGGVEKLVGLPDKPITFKNGDVYIPGPLKVAHDVARDYTREHGIPYAPPRTYAPVDVERAQRIAEAYDKMANRPNDPRVKASYDAMIKETVDQFRAIEKTGLKIEFIKPGQADPYAESPRRAAMDVRDNNHLWVYPTDIGFGTGEGGVAQDNPLLAPTDVVVDGKKLVANDVFRIVHDYFGHIKDGNGFRAAGEENAWRSHSAMYSELARMAMTEETRGQNSWVNYGPHGEVNRTASAADTHYAEQKAGVLPKWVMDEGRGDPEAREFSQRTAQLIDLPKSVVDGLKRDAQALTDLLQSETFSAKGLRDGAVKSSVVRHVIDVVGSDQQVLQSVIRSLPVDVVNFLRREKLSAEHVLSDPAVLENVLASDEKASVSLGVNKSVATALVRSIARSATEIADLAGGSFKGRAAGVAGASDAVSGTHGREDITNNPAFSRWFGDSKIVDGEGKPRVVYHGTDADFSAFQHTEDIGFHFGDASTAAKRVLSASGYGVVQGEKAKAAYTMALRAGHVPEGGNLMPVYLHIEHPLRWPDLHTWSPNDVLSQMVRSRILTEEEVDAASGDVIDREFVRDALARKGYDGIVYKNATEGRGDSYIVFNPEQIKSVANRGTFSPESPNILEQTKKGGFVPGEGGVRSLLTIMRKTADVTTIIHESFHHFINQLMRAAAHPLAPEQLKADAQTALKFAGVEKAEDLLETTPSGRGYSAKAKAAHEKLANGGMQYLYEGVAPSAGLARVFERFKTWMGQLYRSMVDMQATVPNKEWAPLTEEMRHVYDRMFATEPQRTVITDRPPGGPSLADIHEADAKHTEPHEADPAMARVVEETARRETEVPGDVRAEIERAIAEQRGSAGPSAAAGQPGGAGGGGAAELGALSGARGAAGPVAGGGALAERPSAVGGSSGQAGAEGAPASGGADGGAGQPGGSQRPKPASPIAALAPEPADTIPRAAPKFTDKAGNIRLENLDTPESINQALKEIAEAHQDFTFDRRAPSSPGQVLDLAKAMGKDGAEDLVDKWVRGRAYNAEQVVALRLLFTDASKATGTAMKVAAESGKPEDIAAYAAARQRLIGIQRVVSGATAEAGRALAAFRSLKGVATFNDELAAKATGKTLFQLQVEAKLGGRYDDPVQVAEYIQKEGQTRSIGRMIVEFWTNNLISGPMTHMTYTVGNQIISLMQHGPETLAAAAVGRLAQRLGREGEVIPFGEARARLRGLRLAQAAAAQAGLEGLRSGMTTRLPGEEVRPLIPFTDDQALTVAKSLSLDPVTWREVMGDLYGFTTGIRDAIRATAEMVSAGGEPGAPVVGLSYSPLGQMPDVAIKGVPSIPVGSFFRLPGRFIAALHSYGRVSNQRAILAGEAFRAATADAEAAQKAGRPMSGNDFFQRMAHWQKNPTDEMLERSVGGATTLALMGKGGPFLQLFSRLTNTTIKLPVLGETPILKFVDPFVKIAGNVMNQAVLQRTPVGLLTPSLREDVMGIHGTIAQDTAIGRMVVGSAMAIAFGTLAAEGYMSGSGPSDPKEAAVWRLAGNQAHSVRIGDMWYQVNRLGPWGMLGSIAADLYDVAHAASHGDMAQAAGVLQMAFTQNILDESFMRGPADLIKAVEDPGRYGEGYIKNMLSSFVPFSVGLAQMDRAMDPYQRDARTVMDAIKAKVPGISESLYPRRDVWGEALPNTQGLIPGVLAIYEQRVSKDPVNLAMLRIGVFPGKLERKILNIDLTPEQYDDFQRLAGRIAKQRLDVIVKSAEFNGWPTYVQHDVMTEQINQAREAGRQMMIMKYQQIARDATLAKRARLLGTAQ